MRRSLISIATLLFVACGAAPRAPVKKRGARDRDLDAIMRNCGGAAWPVTYMAQYNACNQLSVRMGSPENLSRWFGERPELADAVKRACNAEVGVLAGQMKEAEQSACVIAARAGVLPRSQWHDVLVPICQHMANGTEDVSVLDLNGDSTKREGACDLLVHSDVLLPEERDTFLRMMCYKGAANQCELLAGDPQTATTDTTRSWAADRLMGVAIQKCPQGHMGACEMLQRWSFRDPGGFAGLIAAGRAARAVIVQQENERLAAIERELDAEAREERRLDREEHEQRMAANEARNQEMYRQTMQMAKDQQAWRDEQNRQAVELARGPARPAPAQPNVATTGSAQTSAASPSQPAPPPQPPPPSPAEKKQAFDTCMSKLPPPTTVSRGDGFGPSQGAFAAGLKVATECPTATLGKCAADVHAAIDSARGGAKLHMWGDDVKRVQQRRDRIAGKPVMNGAPSCTLNDMTVRTANTYCFDAQQNRAGCVSTLQQGLAVLQCAGQFSHFLDNAEAADEYETQKTELTASCRKQSGYDGN